jgi:putative membrane protein insertion efficiency factor
MLAVVLLTAASPAGTALALAGIHGYQHTLGPLLGRAGFRCRFTPTCSRYAEVVITRHGLLAGGWQTAKRIARCGPWTEAGTIDEPQ